MHSDRKTSRTRNESPDFLANEHRTNSEGGNDHGANFRVMIARQEAICRASPDWLSDRKGLMHIEQTVATKIDET